MKTDHNNHKNKIIIATDLKLAHTPSLAYYIKCYYLSETIKIIIKIIKFKQDNHFKKNN